MAVFHKGQRLILVRECPPDCVGLPCSFIEYKLTPKGSLMCGDLGSCGFLSRDLDCFVRFDDAPHASYADLSTRFEPLVPEASKEQLEEFQREPTEETDHA